MRKDQACSELQKNFSVMACNHENSFPSLLRLKKMQFQFLWFSSKTDKPATVFLVSQSSVLQFSEIISVLQTGLPYFSFYETLEREKGWITLLKITFPSGGSPSQSSLLLASIALFLLWYLLFLWCFLFPHQGACLFLFFYKQSLILGFLVQTPQPNSLRSKVGIQKVNEKFSLCPWGLKRG